MPQEKVAPIIDHKKYGEPSVFLPENLLREARRQKNLKNCDVPQICVLDPDGDLLRYLLGEGEAQMNNCWACYHSKLYTFQMDQVTVGIVPNIVGASYAVLVAEQLFVSGCTCLISVTSAGIINKPSIKKRFALITEAIRDEGTSYHYLPKEVPATLDELLYGLLRDPSKNALWFDAKSWTTDAPYRETSSSIREMQKRKVNCVEMEASALYAFAKAKNRKVICFAHLTNTMAQNEGDFEKGTHFGSVETLRLIRGILRKLSFLDPN